MKKYDGKQDLTPYKYLLLGDISGIQDFIFNVKSEGAAKTLKGRSFFVHALATLCLDMVESELDADDTLLFYNGGGSFYVFCKKLPDADLDRMRNLIQRDLADTEIYITLTKLDFEKDKFGKVWKVIHQKANVEKMRKFSLFQPAFNATRKRPETETNEKKAWDWKGFVSRFKEEDTFDVPAEVQSSQPGCRVSPTRLIALQRSWKVGGSRKLESPIFNALPLWKDIWDMPGMSEHRDWLFERDKAKDENAEKTKREDILTFETLALLAHQRTGTEKLGVLKMDVDCLGAKFQAMEKAEDAWKLSSAMQQFFGESLYKLWHTGSFKHQDADIPYKNNIYTVFAGGDDCMFIGGWDAIFEFAAALNQEFKNFTKENHTLSASLTVVDGKFPVVRFGEMAEESLHAAKKEAPLVKNRISVFGNVLTWEEYGEAHKIAVALQKLIQNDKVKRRIIHRIQMSHIGYNALQEKALNDNTISNPQIWRLFYFIRESESFEYLESIIGIYQKSLLSAITLKKRLNAAAMLPTAARWAEFLTRKKSIKNERQ